MVSGDKRKVLSVRSFAAGGMAGAVKISLLMPLDTMKTQAQISTGAASASSMRATFARIAASEAGLGGFYYGFTAALLQQIGKVGVQFGAFESWRNVFSIASAGNQDDDAYVKSENAMNALAGAFAGATEALLWTTPTDRIKTLRQAQIGAPDGANKYRGMYSAAREVVRIEGISGMFRGALPTVLRQSSSLAVRFSAYHAISRQLLESKVGFSNDGARPSWHVPLSGALCGAISVILNNPVDVIKSRLQAESNTRLHRGMVATLKSSVASEGAGVLYKGISPRLLKIGVGQAIVFSIYENITAAVGK